MGDDLVLPGTTLISQLMLDAVGQALIATDLAGMVTFWNAAAERMYGWSALEAVGRPIAELTVPEMGQSQAAEILAALADGQSWTGEFTVQRRDGTRFPATVSDSGIYDDSGDLVGIIGVSTDLTETRKAELARLDSEVRLQAIVDNSPVILVAFDAEGTITLAEGRDLAGLGIAGETILGMRLGELAAVLPAAAQSVHRGLAGESTDGVLAARGNHFDFRVRPRWDTTGQIEGVLAIGSDVTVSVKAARESRRREDRWQSVVAQSADAALIGDSATTAITYASPAMTRLFGWEPENLIGRTGLSLVHPEDRQRVIETLGAVAEDANAHPTVEFRLECADGSYRWVEETISNLAAVPGVQGLVGNLRDITDRIEAEAALRASEARYRLIAETAQEGIWATDLQGKTLYANQKMADLLGLMLPDIYDKPVGESLSGDAYTSFLKLTLRGEKAVSEKCDLRHTRPDGSARILQVSVSPFLDAGRLLGSLAMVSDITDGRNAEDQLRHRASHDPLTGLANRTLMLDGLQAALDHLAASGSDPVAVLVADIDRFKLVNDSFGHAAGDELLMEVSRRWLPEIGPEHLLARFGGDEFVALCHGGEEAVREVAARLLRALDTPVLVGGGSVAVDASIGIARAEVGDPVNAETLVRYADAAMYEAKARGRGRTEVFTHGLIDRAQRRLQLFNDLKMAISGDELVLHYQPIVDLATGELLGVEALCRWNHSQRGPVAPDEFIPAAEAGGLIESLDRWVLSRACRDASELRAAGVLPLGGYVSINVSAASLARPDYEAGVQMALDEAALPATAVVLEVTESAVMTDPDAARCVLESLETLGVRIAIDDFGTGYSSLAYLRRFPVRTLKIDRAFVRHVSEDHEDRAIVAAVIDLATALTVTTTAEGIETPADLALLQQLGCHAGQGFLWSPALPPAQLRALMKQLPQGRFAVHDQPRPHSPRPLPQPRAQKAHRSSGSGRVGDQGAGW